MNKSDLSLNLSMLKGTLAKNGFERWRHQFTGYNQVSGTSKTFFVEYYICNPAIGNGHPILGQLPINQALGRKPSYAMVKVGVWGEHAKQLHNFYAFSEVKHEKHHLHLRIGDCVLSETHLNGTCSITERESCEHPEYMSDAGEMSWNLDIQKKIAYHVGRTTSKLYRKFNTLENLWHAEGIHTEYCGSVELDGEKYVVCSETSYGYADKHWGSNFDLPWIWLSGCHLKNTITGKTLENSAFVFKGGKTTKRGMASNKQLYGGLYYEGVMYNYSFNKITHQPKIAFEFEEDEMTNTWKVKAENKRSILSLVMTCPKKEMLFLNYEAPDGKIIHNNLWSGGTGYGTIELYNKKHQRVDRLEFQNAGCEYGDA